VLKAPALGFQTSYRPGADVNISFCLFSLCVFNLNVEVPSGFYAFAFITNRRSPKNYT
jgi:hypothetical protein